MIQSLRDENAGSVIPYNRVKIPTCEGMVLSEVLLADNGEY